LVGTQSNGDDIENLSVTMSAFNGDIATFIGVIGNDGDAWIPYCFSGLLDDVMIFNKALSAEEIAYLYEGRESLVEIDSQDIESAINSAIAADDDLQTLISGRFYLQELPQKELLPAITYQRIDTEFHHTLKDTIKLRKPIFQFNVWAATLAEVIPIVAELETCLTGMKGNWGNIKVENVKPIDEGDISDLEPNEELKRRGRRIDYEFWIQEII
jgi:hypothetical protein